MAEQVTVVIPVYNGAAFVARALSSVLDQTAPPAAVIVSDNCSTDGTCDAVSPFLTDPRVKLLLQPRNVGMAGNFNECLRAVATPFYCMLFHDDYVLDRGAFEKALAVMREDPKAVSVYCDLQYVGPAGDPVLARRFGQSGAIDVDRQARRSILATRNLFGIAVLNRTSAIAGLEYDASLPYLVDIDFSIAIGRRGTVHRIPEMLIANRFHAANCTFGLLRGLYQEEVRMAAKHGIRLSVLDRVRVHCNSLLSAAQRVAFQRFVLWSSRGSDPACQRS